MKKMKRWASMLLTICILIAAMPHPAMAEPAGTPMAAQTAMTAEPTGTLESAPATEPTDAPTSEPTDAPAAEPLPMLAAAPVARAADVILMIEVDREKAPEGESLQHRYADKRGRQRHGAALRQHRRARGQAGRRLCGIIRIHGILGLGHMGVEGFAIGAGPNRQT